MVLDFFAGCLGGCASTVVGYPLDTIKVHIQTQNNQNIKYKGTWHCFRTLITNESIAGLYRGMSSPMAGVAVINAIVFGVYSQTKRQMDENHWSCHFLAGAAAGLVQTPVCSPLDLAKTRLQLQQSTNQKFTSPLQCLRHIFKVEGFRGVFNGFGVTCLREAPSYGVYFATYEAMTRKNSSNTISTLHMLFAGGTAGSASWVVSYPLDVIKSRMQADGTGRYSSAMDCYRQSVRAEGYSCLFRGLSTTIIRAFPTNAATFAVVTWTFRLLGDKKEMDQAQVEVPKYPNQAREQVTMSHRTFTDRWHNFIENVSGRKTYIESFHPTMTLSLVGNAIENNSKYYEMEMTEDPIMTKSNDEDDDYVAEDETCDERFTCEWII